MHCKVDNAIIMAAGVSSRFAPISYERPKALIKVKNEVLIERQIRQLKEAGVPQIIVVVGYKKEQFSYLQEQFGVVIVENPEYAVRNNNGSIYAVRKYLKNSYICSADNYFTNNPFEKEVSGSYYAAVYAAGATNEWCMEEDDNGLIKTVQIGGEKAWYMLGHAFWTEAFSRKFLEILKREYKYPKTRDKLWEKIFMEHLEELPMKIRKYNHEDIYEFDSLDELREFDSIYKVNSGSAILENIAKRLNCKEGELKKIIPQKDAQGEVTGFHFHSPKGIYKYDYNTGTLSQI